jgi:hypothetical protein
VAVPDEKKPPPLAHAATTVSWVAAAPAAPAAPAAGALVAGWGMHAHADPAAGPAVTPDFEGADEPALGDGVGGTAAWQEVGGSHAGGTGDTEARSLVLTAFPPPSAATTFPAGAPIEPTEVKSAGRCTARATQPVAVGVSASEPYAVVSITFAVGADVRAATTRIGWGCPAPTTCVLTTWRGPEEAGCHSGVPV